MTTRTIYAVVISIVVITVVSIAAATVLEMADHDASAVWKLAGTGLLALAGVLVGSRAVTNGNGHK